MSSRPAPREKSGRGRRPRLLPAVVATMAALATLAGAGYAQDHDLFAAHLDLVRQYREGSPESAVRELMAWPAGDMDRVAVRLEELFASASDPTPPPVATVAIHTEAGFRLREGGRHELADRHLALARRVVSLTAPDSGGLSPEGALGPVWFRAVGYHYTAHAFVDRAETLLEEGLERFPGDARLWLARGGVDELIASVGAQREDGQRDRSPRDSRGRTRGESKHRYEDAAEAYRTALDLDPGLARARLRLGRVSHELGRLDEAERMLREVETGAADPTVEFLTRLFLGDLLEDRGDARQALVEYRAAVALHPESSSARLALSYAQLRSGARAAAADDARAALEAGDQEDRWLSYLAGAVELQAATLELRELGTAGAEVAG